MKRFTLWLPWLFGIANVLLKVIFWCTAGPWAPAFWMRIDFPISLALEPIAHALISPVFEVTWFLVGFLWYYAIGLAYAE
jgi:hypothetical protein